MGIMLLARVVFTTTPLLNTRLIRTRLVFNTRLILTSESN